MNLDLTGWPGNPKDLPVSTFEVLGLTQCTPHTRVWCGYWGSKLGPHASQANHGLTELSLQLSDLKLHSAVSICL